jgi:Coenzyme PQQ synthesis protein D (PqqD)
MPLKGEWEMTLAARYKVNAPTVTHETIEGESVIINLETGNYYSLQGTGADIWALIAKNIPVSDIVEDLTQRYSGVRADIKECITGLLLELQSEQLIVPGQLTNGSNSGDGLSVALHSTKCDFQTPQLQKFTDMQELLLLDPIHEVDAAGWPSAKQDASAD